ncbi:MAG: hypothetical protein Q8R15_04080 [Candidatus Micrarchaeota archaeon]|nr:hypothetical protein [Candidatus Micrarchaeota archaeon]
MAEMFIPEKIRKRGSLRYFKTPSGSHVIVLPTCTVPLEHLVRENWYGGENVGNFRQVKKITHVQNGALLKDSKGNPTELYVKSPEREFNIDSGSIHGIWRDILDVENFKSHVSLKGETRVEKQAVWEARILLGLAQNGINAEEPQAIVIYPGGNREVITKGKEGIAFAFPEQIKRLIRVARSKGFTPDDLHSGNVISDEDDNHSIIDVNRWTWPPFTNEYKKRLITAVGEEIKRQKREK